MTQRYSLAELEAEFPPVQPATVASAAGALSNVFALFGERPAIWGTYTNLPDLNAAAQSDLPNTNWFDEIDSALQLQLLSADCCQFGHSCSCRRAAGCLAEPAFQLC